MLTKEYLEEQIVDTQYQKMGLKTTICLLTLKNGFEVVGTSACIDASIFDFAEGMKWAFEDAFNKLWELEGYVAQSRLADKK